MPRRNDVTPPSISRDVGEILGDAFAIIDQPIGLLACDWNGTIVADAVRACAATNAVLTALNLPRIDLSGFLASFCLPLDAFLGGFGVDAERLGDAIGRWNAELATRSTQLAPGAWELLRTVRALGMRSGVISAAAADAISNDVSALGIGDWLDFVVGSATSKSAALGPLVHASVGRVLYIGDTEYDMTEAMRAGALPVGVGNGYRPAAALLAAGAACVVPDLSALTELLLVTQPITRD